MKLKESISSNSVKIIELYNKIDSEVLDTSPDFQRKLVWKKQHKYAFINTILLNYPFPEIYIASSEIDVNKIKTREIVVDGKQRLTAIVDYIKGANDFASTKKVKSFESLSLEEKRDFLNYPVSVKDLKDIDPATIKLIFQKINSTDYSLNANEIINAKYGDGEFMMFCKQLADLGFTPAEEMTDIIIDTSVKNSVNSFFHNNFIFSDNDRSRMYDLQFLLLIVSTILEENYFGRSARINYYLEKYNLEFSEYTSILEKVSKVIEGVNKLNFQPGSYWFNKANIFTLFIELSKSDLGKINFDVFESKLLELEKKVDIYYTDDDISGITEDEKKYFEYSRQGSNELQAREHRGLLIRGLIQNSLLEFQNLTEVESNNISEIQEVTSEFVLLTLTTTNLTKKIIDAISSIRTFFVRNNIHDYHNQELGPDHKVTKDAWIFNNDFLKTSCVLSLYRTGRGDNRLWISDLHTYVNQGNKIAIFIYKKEINIINISINKLTKSWQGKE